MAEPFPSPESGDDTGVAPGRSTTGISWRMVVGIVVVAVVVGLVIVLHLMGGGLRGPH